MVANYEKIGMNITPGQVFLNLIPPFLAYGLVNSMHMPLCMGMSEVIIPPMNPMDFYKQVKQYKPAHVLATVVHYECLMNAAKENDDFSFFLDPGAGGDVLLESMETRINNFLKLHGCNHKLAKGYGMTEMSSCAITVTNDDYNVSGSVGIPLPLNNIAIINPENGKEVEYDQVGEICMTGPTLMLKYVNNEQETNNAIYYDAKGIRWIHTGDLGHITKDGIVFVDGRIKRMIVKAGGFKIYPAKIEEIIMQNEAIEYGAVLGVSMENQGAVPVAYVKLKMGYQFEDVKTKLLKQLAGSLPDYAIPAEIISIENMPFTKSNKINYKKLEEHYFTHH